MCGDGVKSLSGDLPFVSIMMASVGDDGIRLENYYVGVFCL